MANVVITGYPGCEGQLKIKDISFDQASSIRGFMAEINYEANPSLAGFELIRAFVTTELNISHEKFFFGPDADAASAVMSPKRDPRDAIIARYDAALKRGIMLSA